MVFILPEMEIFCLLWLEQKLVSQLTKHSVNSEYKRQAAGSKNRSEWQKKINKILCLWANILALLKWKNGINYAWNQDALPDFCGKIILDLIIPRMSAYMLPWLKCGRWLHLLHWHIGRRGKIQATTSCHIVWIRALKTCSGLPAAEAKRHPWPMSL